MDTMIETVRNTAALEAIRSVLETHVLFNENSQKPVATVRS